MAPLDWGLGHATRCIPIIRYLLEKHCEVTIAAEGAVAMLLRGNFPELRILVIKGYRISYSGHASTFAFRILAQVPKILKGIRDERKWLAKTQEDNQFDLIISDNRYGLKIEGLTSVIMTHQLQIRSDAGALADRLLRFAHYRILERFDECWVVDDLGKTSIGGTLSHPERIPDNAHYIGLLSQLTLDDPRPNTKEGGVLILLSGPEPQRSLLEQKILSQITSKSAFQYTIVAGNPGGAVPDGVPSGIDYHTHLNALQLQGFMANADLVVCRSGYSTLMDLATMGKKALLIPTPGQSEQEYLAKHLGKQGLFFFSNQSSLELEHDITQALERPGFGIRATHIQHQVMKAAVDETLQRLTGV